MRTKILVCSDSATLPTGFAETTRLIFETLLETYPEEYEIHQLGHFHSTSSIRPKWPVYATVIERDPKGTFRFAEGDKYGQLTFSKLCARLRPDIVFGYGDPQGVAHLCLTPLLKTYSLILYLTIDGMPIPEGYGPVLSQADALFTMTEFSLQVLLSAYPQLKDLRSGFLYSPADVDCFLPASPDQKRLLRVRYFPKWIPQDAFIMGWVGRNQWRKQIWLPYQVLHYLRSGAYYACAKCKKVRCLFWNPSTQSHAVGPEFTSEPLADRGPCACAYCGSAIDAQGSPGQKDIFLWNHMASDTFAWSPKLLEWQFDVHPGRDLIYTEDYRLSNPLPKPALRDLYQMFDCLLFLSGGEGFGIPAWECLACGVPVVYTNYSAHGEFLRRSGGGIGVDGVLQPEQLTCIWRMIADVHQSVEAVLRLHSEPALREQLGARGREFVLGHGRRVQAGKWHEIFQAHKHCVRKGSNCQIAIPLE